MFGSQGNALVLADAYQLVARVPSGVVDLVYLDPPMFPLAGTDGGDKALREHLRSFGLVLQQVRRALSPTGTLFVHSVPQQNGHIRLLLDQVYGRQNFRHEYVLPLISAGIRGTGHDTVFFYSVGEAFVSNPVPRPLTADEVAAYTEEDGSGRRYRLVGLLRPVARTSLAYTWRGFEPPANYSWRYAAGRLDSLFQEGRIVIPEHGALPKMKQYLDEQPEAEIGSVWSDLRLSITTLERVGYPSQKPIDLLDRVIRIGSTAGCVICDPYCGSGTTLVAAQMLNRRWIGGDNNAEAVAITRKRLASVFSISEPSGFQSYDETALRARGGESPIPRKTLTTGIDDLQPHFDARYTLGAVLEGDESRHMEFKEVRGSNPVSAIVNAADEYAVSFLNSEGGRILWGVRDKDRVVVGVPLSSQQRDQLRRDVSNKIHSIQPQIDPTQYEFVLHPLDAGNATQPLFVVELKVPEVASSEPYFTSSHETYVRVDGVTRKLSGPQLTDWIKRRSRVPLAAATGTPSLEIGALVSRVRRVLSAHGLETAHLGRFFAAMGASFEFRLKDAQSDDAFVEWLDDVKLDWIAKILGVRREWIDGEDSQIYQRWWFDKNPREFWNSLGAPIEIDAGRRWPGAAQAFFIRWGRGKDWSKRARSSVFVVVAVPLVQLNTERVIYRYVTDFTPHPWTGRRTNIQLRAWTRLLYCQGGFFVSGREMSYEMGEQFGNNSRFLREFLEDQKAVSPIEWHPDDYALSAAESVVAKQTETFPEVLDFLQKHGLPTDAGAGFLRGRQIGPEP